MDIRSDCDVEINDNKYDQLFDATADADEPAPVATTPYSILPTDEDREIILDNAIDELAEIARENILEFKREDFNDKEVIGVWIDSYLCEYFSEMTVDHGYGFGCVPHRSNYSSASAVEADALNDVLDAYICELYDELFERFYEEIAPPRVSSRSSDTDNPVGLSNDAIREMTQKIQTLREKPQPDQRTPEWYARRNNLITASAASKAFGSQASVNQLIYEKCKNHTTSTGVGSVGSDSGSGGTPLQGSVNSPLHWGQRYEPVTVMVYESRNKTRLGEFGCIQHDTFPFIGASPDGINIDPTSPIYGRMVEIKNIFNREITGSPKEEYWIQTQIQMEVCDLDECDFVETRFKEYDSEAEYLADIGDGGHTGYTARGNEKGIILWFQTGPVLTQQGYVSPPIQLYEYVPIGGMTAEEYDTWETAVFAKHESRGNIWVRTIYWYLDEYSCVLIRRNRLWFSEAVRVLQDVWTMIERERETGYEHRAPVKRKPATSVAAGTAAGTPPGSTEFKIIKLETAIVPTTTDNIVLSNGNETTATNMATLMAINNNMFQTNKKYGSGGRHVSKGPSDVLISCFKINDLEIDVSKI
jgi:putative phage-type endonuclease